MKFLFAGLTHPYHRPGYSAMIHQHHHPIPSTTLPPPVAHSHSGASSSHHPSGTVSTNQRPALDGDEVLDQITKLVAPTDDDCCICYERLKDFSGQDLNDTPNGLQVVELSRCKHTFHRMCLLSLYNNGNKDGSVQCPTCKAVYGEKYGNSPDGYMQYQTLNSKLPGHPDCTTIRIMYMISPGIQGPGHPHPGQPYTCRAFPRIAFIPNNDEGRKVLELLIKAWKRRLIFTVGTSSTTGESDTVVWNEIHHKTEMQSSSGHGYPDPNYLKNVTLELALQGISDE